MNNLSDSTSEIYMFFLVSEFVSADAADLML